LLYEPAVCEYRLSEVLTLVFVETAEATLFVYTGALNMTSPKVVSEPEDDAFCVVVVYVGALRTRDPNPASEVELLVVKVCVPRFVQGASAEVESWLAPTEV
jgi:hypothetical protein